MPTLPTMLSEDEERRILAAFLTARGATGTDATDADAQRVLAWAQLARLQAALLAGILHGECLVDVFEGALVFGVPIPDPSEPVH